MKKMLFPVCIIFAILGCGGENIDDLPPCLTCLISVYDKCGDQAYDSSKEVCFEGTVYPKCGDSRYNPSTQFCSENSVYSKCGGSEYNPSTLFCSDGTVKTYSGSVTYQGQTYKTMVIGTQTWMAENLNYAVEGSKCYSNDLANCGKYGRLYDWTTAMALTSSCNSSSCSSQIQATHRGICPSGWHIPTNAEWAVLGNHVGNRAKLKATSGWTYFNGASGNNGTDDYGFSALPGGYGLSDGRFSSVGSYGLWWSATEFDDNYVSAYGIENSHSIGKSDLFSVRCLQDFKCGGNDYNPSTQFCSTQDSGIYDKCGGSNYNTDTHGCCNTTTFALPTQFCSGNKIYSKCGGNDYNPSTQYCSNSTVKAYSGSVTYQGQTYKTTVIGTQTWMAENLNYDPGTGNSACYDNQASNCAIYGRLYDWSTAMNLESSCNSSSCSSQIQAKHRGVCPSGWHIPTDAEWTVLMDYVGSSTALKAISGWRDYDVFVSGNGTDDYGFSALPGGCGYSDGSFGSVGRYGYWWSSTEGTNLAYYRNMDYYYSNVGRSLSSKSNLYRVRCLQD